MIIRFTGADKLNFALHLCGTTHAVLSHGALEVSEALRRVVEVRDCLMQGICRVVGKLVLEITKSNRALIKIFGGQVIFENGLPVHSDEVQVLGNGVYKVTGGWRNEFTYKNITLSFLIDFKAGAKMFSGTNLSLYSNGLHKNTLQGRGADGKGTMVGNGVMSDGKGGYVKNTVAVSAQDYWQALKAADSVGNKMEVYRLRREIYVKSVHELFKILFV